MKKRFFEHAFKVHVQAADSIAQHREIWSNLASVPARKPPSRSQTRPPVRQIHTPRSPAHSKASTELEKLINSIETAHPHPPGQHECPQGASLNLEHPNHRRLPSNKG